MAISPNAGATSSTWRVDLLGNFNVVSESNVRPTFRSRSVRLLLALLCLSPNQRASRFALQEALWPESEGDRQAQNLRKAVSDLRDALAQESDRSNLIQTQRDLIALDSSRFIIDAEEFKTASEAGLRDRDFAQLTRAISVYQGPLLGDFPESWVYAFRMEFEERFAQSLELLAEVGIAEGDPKEVLRLARAALTHSSQREEIHIALILAYRACGLEAEAIRQFEDLERMLDENWGEQPSKRAVAALQGPVPVAATRTPTVALVAVPDPLKPSPSSTEPSGGAVPLSSAFYVRRSADVEAESAVAQREGVVLVHGPRQVGKSSLLARTLQFAREQGTKVVVTDFQTLGGTQLAEIDKFYQTLAFTLARQLECESNLDTWNPWMGPNMNLDSTVDVLLRQAGGPVVWGIDEVDRLFGRDYADDFFGLLRSWHNRRAFEPDGPWRHLTLVLAYATEAHLFVRDLNQSPFNVGIRIKMLDFDLAAITRLADRYGLSEDVAVEVQALTHGQPFLTRRAMEFLTQGGTMTALKESAHLHDGPFSDHLHRLLVSISYDEQMVREVKRLLCSDVFEHATTGLRLWSAGLLDGTSPDGVARFRVPIYRDYFLSQLA